jgi:hypothetical protein
MPLVSADKIGSAAGHSTVTSVTSCGRKCASIVTYSVNGSTVSAHIGGASKVHVGDALVYNQTDPSSVMLTSDWDGRRSAAITAIAIPISAIALLIGVNAVGRRRRIRYRDLRPGTPIIGIRRAALSKGLIWRVRFGDGRSVYYVRTGLVEGLLARPETDLAVVEVSRRDRVLLGITH